MPPRKPKSAPPQVVYERLATLYPDAECELTFTSPLELLIATILSAQCTDVRVNLVTATLFQKYRKPEDYLAVPAEELEEDIHSTGFFRNKAKNIRGACQRLLEVYGGEVPDSMEELLTLPGVARKTANVVLGNIFNKAEGIAVDTHVTRLSGLLGLSVHTDPPKIERDLMRLFPQAQWTLISHLLILHGRRVCIARRPQCAACVLNDVCPSAFKLEKAKTELTAKTQRTPGGRKQGAGVKPATEPKPPVS
jgi:endonuclease-3